MNLKGFLGRMLFGNGIVGLIVLIQDYSNLLFIPAVVFTVGCVLWADENEGRNNANHETKGRDI